MIKIKTRGKIIISIITIFINLYCLFVFTNFYHSLYQPTLPKVDITQILKKQPISDGDYTLLYSQTGLGKQAINDILGMENGLNKVLSFQNSYFRVNGIFTERINPFTSQETIVINSSNNNNNVELAPLKNGDILLTKSAHTFYWRHGHCGIVINAEKGITLESLVPGTISMTQDISKWLSYSTLKVLRLKDTSPEKLNEIAQYAEQKLMGIKYNIFALKRYDDTIPKSENCSLLVWQAFKHFGYDIDGNKGLLVTPEDIAKSDLFDIIQVHGFYPDKPW